MTATAALNQKWKLLVRLLPFLCNDIPISVGLALLIVSPYFLEKVGSGSYFAFNIVDDFLTPHLESVAVLAVLMLLVIVTIRHCGPRSRWLRILPAALFAVFLVRGFLLTAGVSPQSIAEILYNWFSFLKQDWIDPVLFRRLGALVLFGLGLIVLGKLRDSKPWFRACSAFGWVLGVITLFRVVPLIDSDAQFLAARQQTLAHSKSSSAAVNKRVVWVIFDELDYGRVFSRRNSNLVLNNFDRLKREGVSGTNAAAPAMSTSISLPALITGTSVKAATPEGPGKLLLETQSGHVEWGGAPSVFSRLNESGKKISILGVYHPYCNIFLYADPCSSQPFFSYSGVWWWGLWQGLRVIPGVDLTSRRFNWTTQAYNEATRMQLKTLESHLSNRSAALSFIHMNIPHLPGQRVHGAALTKEAKALSGYDQNLLTADWMIGKLVETLEAQSESQDILLIVSSDHGLRTKLNAAALSPDQIRIELGDDRTESHSIPLLIRRMREKSQKVILQPISTLHTGQLIEDFFSGSVYDHASIAKWWLAKPYVESILPEDLNSK